MYQDATIADQVCKKMNAELLKKGLKLNDEWFEVETIGINQVEDFQKEIKELIENYSW